MGFTHLHVHTEYSLLDGSSKIKELVAQAKALGMDSIAITDHGVMYGVIDFYKAAHHGSNGSNSQGFLEALSPKAAVVSCGSRNPYGHPGKEALERFRLAGSRIFCTAELGQVSFWLREGDVRVRWFLPKS